MKRDNTILVLCALFLLADALCLRETILFRQTLENLFFAVTLVCQIFSAILILSLIYLIVKRKFLRNKTFTLNFELFQPLRRVLLSVWTLKFVRR